MNHTFKYKVGDVIKDSGKLYEIVGLTMYHGLEHYLILNKNTRSKINVNVRLLDNKLDVTLVDNEIKVNLIRGILS